MKQHWVLWTLGIVALAVSGLALSALEIVNPGEVVVVRRLGRRLQPSWGPGLHLGLPAPLERRDKVRVSEVRTMEIGRSSDVDSLDDPGAGEFLTGDRNLLIARVVIQYRLADPGIYVARGGDSHVPPLLRRLAESSLSRVLATRGVDHVLHAGRGEAANAIRESLRERIESLNLGLAVLSVSVTEARPPVEVLSAFSEAQSARSARDQQIQDAATYASTTRESVRAKAAALIERAQGETSRTIAMARARAETFEALRVESLTNRQQTFQRIYVDAVRSLLPRTRRTVVLGSEDALDLTIMDAGRNPR